MPITGVAEVRGIDSGLAAIKAHLHECWLIAERLPDLAARDFRDDEAYAEFNAAAEDLSAAILDEAEARLALAVQAAREMTERSELTEAEHAAQERAAYRVRIL